MWALFLLLATQGWAAEIKGVPDPAMKRALEQMVRPDPAITRELVLSYLQNKGYLEAKFDGTTVDLGPRYMFGETRITGLEKYPEDRLRLDLPYARGQPYERSKLLDLQRKLFGLGLFDDIRISASTGTARDADVLLAVRERPMKWVRAGAGYGSEERERISLILTHNNMFRRGYKFELAGQYSHIWLDWRGSFINRHVFGSRVEQRTDVSWRRENRRGYDLERLLGQAGFAVGLPWRARVETRYKLEQTVLYHLAQDIAVDQSNNRPASSGFGVTLARDSSNDPFEPSRGTRSALLVERVGGYFGGTVDFNRASLAASTYRGLGPVVVALSGAAGVVREFGDSRTVPIYERFFVGGGNSVRGYRERDIGPKDLEGNPLGGNVLARASLELRFPIWKRLAAALFIDAGQVDPEKGMVAPQFWKAGAGPGLRVKTPVGPLRLDFGYKVNPNPGERALWALHLSLGEAF